MTSTDAPEPVSLISRIRHRMAVPGAAIAFGGLALALFAVPRPVAPVLETLPRMAEVRPDAVEAIRTIPLPAAAREASLATGSTASPATPGASAAPASEGKRIAAPAAPIPPRKPPVIRQVADARPVAENKPVAKEKPAIRRPAPSRPMIVRAPDEPTTILGKTLALGSDALDLTLGGARYAKSAALRLGGAVVDLIED